MVGGLLHVESVAFAYGVDSDWRLAVDDLHLGAERIVCLVGPNGSGKSTLLRLLGGMLQPDAGRILLDQGDLRRMSRPEIARRIGYLPQESPALFDLRIDEVVMMGRYVHGLGLGGVSRRDEVVVSDALAAVDLSAFGHRRLSQVSGGERRRALVASVLAQEPQLMLLDEPTSSLDIHHAVELMRLLSGFSSDGPSVVVVTHDLNLASLFADRIILLQGGRIYRDGDPCRVITHEILHEVYGPGLLVEQHPQAGTPLVIPACESHRLAGGVHAV